MKHYNHLHVKEREKLYRLFQEGMSKRLIAKQLDRSPSTISRGFCRVYGLKMIMTKAWSAPMP